MTFSANFDLDKGKPVEDTIQFSNLTDPRDHDTEASYADVASPHDEIFSVTLEATMRVLESGVLGDPNGRYRISITGHGNENHEPTPGWANDFVNFSITQL